MRFTIERIRTLVLVAGVLLVVALAVFLGVGKWKSLLQPPRSAQAAGRQHPAGGQRRTPSSMPSARTRSTRFTPQKKCSSRTTAFCCMTSRSSSMAQDGNRVDRIAGDTFEYDQKSGVATAPGPVEMMLMRPAWRRHAPRPRREAASGKESPPPAAPRRLQRRDSREDQRSDLRPEQRRGDDRAARGFLHDAGIGQRHGRHVRLAERPPDAGSGGGTDDAPGRRCGGDSRAARGVRPRRTACLLRAATADYRGGQAGAAQAKILFRTDGSAVRLDATGGFHAGHRDGRASGGARGIDGVR